MKRKKKEKRIGKIMKIMMHETSKNTGRQWMEKDEEEGEVDEGGTEERR